MSAIQSCRLFKPFFEVWLARYMRSPLISVQWMVVGNPTKSCHITGANPGFRVFLFRNRESINASVERLTFATFLGTSMLIESFHKPLIGRPLET